jgi:hypothetical protein
MSVEHDSYIALKFCLVSGLRGKGEEVYESYTSNYENLIGVTTNRVIINHSCMGTLTIT